MTKRAKISAKRSGNNVTVTFRNFASGDRWNLWRSNTYNGGFSLVSGNGATATYVDTVGANTTPKYKARYADDSGATDTFNESLLVFNNTQELFSRLPNGVFSKSQFTL